MEYHRTLLPESTATDLIHVISFKHRKGYITLTDHDYLQQYINEHPMDQILKIIESIFKCEFCPTKSPRDRMFIHLLCQFTNVPRFSRRRIRPDYFTKICGECYFRSSSDSSYYDYPGDKPICYCYRCEYITKHIHAHQIYGVDISDTPLKLSRKNRGERNKKIPAYPKVYKNVNYLAQFRVTLPEVLRKQQLIDIDIICVND